MHCRISVSYFRIISDGKFPRVFLTFYRTRMYVIYYMVAMMSSWHFVRYYRYITSLYIHYYTSSYSSTFIIDKLVWIEIYFIFACEALANESEQAKCCPQQAFSCSTRPSQGQFTTFHSHCISLHYHQRKERYSLHMPFQQAHITWIFPEEKRTFHYQQVFLFAFRSDHNTPACFAFADLSLVSFKCTLRAI